MVNNKVIILNILLSSFIMTHFAIDILSVCLIHFRSVCIVPLSDYPRGLFLRFFFTILICQIFLSDNQPHSILSYLIVSYPILPNPIIFYPIATIGARRHHLSYLAMQYRTIQNHSIKMFMTILPYRTKLNF